MIENTRTSIEIHVPAALTVKEDALAYVQKRINTFLNSMSSYRGMSEADHLDSDHKVEGVTVHAHVKVFTLFNDRISRDEILKEVEAFHNGIEYNVYSAPANAQAPLSGLAYETNICVVQVF